MDRQASIAANLARQAIPGARQSIAAFAVKEDTSVMNRSRGDVSPKVVSKHFPIYTDVATDFSSGPITQSGDPLHFAIQGRGSFFRIKDKATGSELVTRNGSFFRATDGRVLTTDGDEVLTEAGTPLTVSSASAVDVDEQGRIQINGTEAGKLGLVHFDNPNEALADAGSGRYTMTKEDLKRPGMAVEDLVLQRSLEYGNTDVVGSAITMMQSLRLFEANQKALSAQDDVTGKLLRTVGEKV
jgi:flagellar basal body rod protein FlgG